jgi:hypothetical protein
MPGGFCKDRLPFFAVFETWHLGDGNYPPIKSGQLANLSFKVEPDEVKLARVDRDGVRVVLSHPSRKERG